VTAVTETPQLDARALALGNALSHQTAPGHTAPDEAVPEGERPSHLRVAPTTSKGVLRRRRRARFAVFAVAAISAASMFLLVAFHVFAVQSAFKLDKLDTQLAAEQRQYGLLRAQVDRASSPEAVATAAARFGMVRTQNVTVLHVLGIRWAGANAAFPIPPKTPYAPLDTPDNGP
jgi:cell division protein FtsL